MTSPKPPPIQRGQIWDVKFDPQVPQVGAEIGKDTPGSCDEYSGSRAAAAPYCRADHNGKSQLQ